MTTFVALLRGINVGKAKRLPMETLRNLLAGLGYENVRTLLNSGNAVFDAPGGAASADANAVATAIATAIAEQLSIEVPVVVKSARQLGTLVAENPFTDRALDHARLLVAFTRDGRSLAGLRELESLVAPTELFTVTRHCAYLYCAAGILESKAGNALLGAAGKHATTRNWATTLKLHAMAGGA
ncbi:MAG: DUF1697 domain-containing protein [Pseudomonadales bacterium]